MNDIAAPAHAGSSRAVDAVPAPALLIGSIVSIQVGASIAVHLFPAIGPVGTTFLRLLIASPLLILAFRRSIDATLRRNAGWLVLFGFTIAATNLAFYGAISRIPLGLAVAIEFVGPLGLAALTSRKPLDFAWIGLAAVGLGLLTPEIGSTLDPLGVGLALVAGAGWAGIVVLSRRVGQRVTGNAGLAFAMVAATAFALPFELAIGGLEHLDLELLGAAAVVAVLSTALPLSLEFEALKRVTPRTYGIFMTLEPVVAAVAGAVLLSQALDSKLVVAVACVTIAALGVTITDRRNVLA
ncbi:MAG TPA: EamA family transporter [Candidatus Limnocylindrales bacterium]|nr:EamA family transporter [Candidatus Limnocylindrales bacterium]